MKLKLPKKKPFRDALKINRWPVNWFDDKKEKERLTVIKEEAYKKRKVKTDAPRQKISEKKKEKPYNPYLAELERSHK